MPFPDRRQHQNFGDYEINEILKALDRDMITCFGLDTKLLFDLFAKTARRHIRYVLPIVHSQSEQVIHVTSHICICSDGIARILTGR